MGLKIGVGLYPSAGMSFNLSSRGSGANIAVAGTIIELENCIRPELIWDYECIGAGIAYHKKIISIGLAYMWQRERNFDGAKILIGLNPF
jgi:hypothetical protein